MYASVQMGNSMNYDYHYVNSILSKGPKYENQQQRLEIENQNH
ncbi:hypothetical protein [Lysinibacillus sp. 2017]|nr:hypothetical protein [Lysinibacillus sp. 2017]